MSAEPYGVDQLSALDAGPDPAAMEPHGGRVTRAAHRAATPGLPSGAAGPNAFDPEIV